ncbi:MAG: elongation factor G [bacterium]
MNAARNAALIAPKGTGKTTLCEAILFSAGATDKMGKVTEGNTASDHDPEEQQRTMTLFPSVCSFQWKKHNLHIVDTAGYPDLIGATKAVAQLMDNAVMPVSGVDGVRTHALKLWRYLNEKSIPRFIFINEADRENASFEKAWKSARETLNFPLVPVTMPLIRNGALAGVIDLVKMKAYVAAADGREKYTEEDVPGESRASADRYRENLIETAAEVDDSLMEKYLEGEEINPDQIKAAVRAGTVSARLAPVFAGSALLDVGIAQFLDYFLDFSAAPEDRGAVKAKDTDGAEIEKKPHVNEPFAAQVFKITIDQYTGKVAAFRVVSGAVKPDSTLYNSASGRKEKIGQIFSICGKKQTSIPSAGPGDVAAVVKIQEIQTGDTLSDPNFPAVIPRPVFPEPVLSIAIKPKERGDEDKLSMGLNRLLEEDPLMRLFRHEQTKELTISGMGQLHVDSIVSQLKRRFAIEVQTSTPQVPYRETVRRTVKVQGKYKRQSGGRGQYGDVWLELEPLPRGQGFEFVNRIFGGAVPRNYIPAVEKGVVEKMAKGVVAGYPVVDMRVTIFDGTYHEVDSSDLAFKIASSMAITKGVAEADPAILEPVMSVEIEVPEENMGDIIGDINGRRGRVTAIDQGPGVKIIKAVVPQAEMLRYAPDLNSMTSGRGSYTMELDHFEEVPRKIAEELIARHEKSRQEDER